VTETYANKTVQDVMHQGCECIAEDKTLVDAARRMAELDVGVMPICGSDDRLRGMLTDRDIVVKALARGMDPSATKVSELAQGTPVVTTVDASIDEALDLMRENTVKRLPVIDENKRLCGIVSEGDLAKHIPREMTGELVGAIAAAEPDHF